MAAWIYRRVSDDKVEIVNGQGRSMCVTKATCLAALANAEEHPDHFGTRERLHEYREMYQGALRALSAETKVQG